jgi:hypothetical protein
MPIHATNAPVHGLPKMAHGLASTEMYFNARPAIFHEVARIVNLVSANRLRMLAQRAVEQLQCVGPFAHPIGMTGHRPHD